MALLLDLFGFLSVLLDGLSLIAQSFTIGGIVFLLLLSRPLVPILGSAGREIETRVRRILTNSALCVTVAVAARTGLLAAILVNTADLTPAEVNGAGFVRSGMIIAAAALFVAGVVRARLDQRRPLLLPLLMCLILAAASQITHGAARLDHRWLLMGLTVVHLASTAVWIGGLPYFLAALAQCRDHVAAGRVGARFSLMAFLSVIALTASGIGMALFYVESPEALYGTAYGAMLTTKVVLYLGILLFGFMNMVIVQRLRRSPDAPLLFMRRFAEVELGIGIAVLLCAASLVSLPPAADLRTDRASWDELSERLTPAYPRLVSPDYDQLAIPLLEAKRAEALKSGHTEALPQAYAPGAGVLVPRTAADIAWSEFNHHWAGIAVILIGLLALLDHSGWAPAARHWPLAFLILAGFVVIRSDPEAWPLGSVGFWDSLRDAEVAQHRLFALLTIGFSLFEWSIRVGRISSPRAALVFPVLVAAGGTLMLTHAHALANVKEELLIEWTHIPVAVLGIAAGWARWLQLRLPPGRSSRFFGWVWPSILVLVGIILVIYREA
jgi:putative copper resistance protein D